MVELETFIRDVPDFPKKGIVFKDITPLLADAGAMRQAVEQLVAPFESEDIAAVTGIESRGFIFGALVARRLGASFVPIRKAGKLPAETVSQSYELEYGSDTIEMHADAIAPGAKVLMIDDLLATGGTMAAACELIEKLAGKIVGISFIIELCFLRGRDKLTGYDVRSLIKVDG